MVIKQSDGCGSGYRYYDKRNITKYNSDCDQHCGCVFYYGISMNYGQMNATCSDTGYRCQVTITNYVKSIDKCHIEKNEDKCVDNCTYYWFEYKSNLAGGPDKNCTIESSCEYAVNSKGIKQEYLNLNTSQCSNSCPSGNEVKRFSINKQIYQICANSQYGCYDVYDATKDNRFKNLQFYDKQQDLCVEQCQYNVYAKNYIYNQYQNQFYLAYMQCTKEDNCNDAYAGNGTHLQYLRSITPSNVCYDQYDSTKQRLYNYNSQQKGVTNLQSCQQIKNQNGDLLLYYNPSNNYCVQKCDYYFYIYGTDKHFTDQQEKRCTSSSSCNDAITKDGQLLSYGQDDQCLENCDKTLYQIKDQNKCLTTCDNYWYNYIYNYLLPQKYIKYCTETASCQSITDQNGTLLEFVYDKQCVNNCSSKQYIQNETHCVDSCQNYWYYYNQNQSTKYCTNSASCDQIYDDNNNQLKYLDYHQCVQYCDQNDYVDDKKCTSYCQYHHYYIYKSVDNDEKQNIKYCSKNSICNDTNYNNRLLTYLKDDQCVENCGYYQNKAFVWYKNEYDGQKTCTPYIDCEDYNYAYDVSTNNECIENPCKIYSAYFVNYFDPQAQDCVTECNTVWYEIEEDYANNSTVKICTSYDYCIQIPEYTFTSYYNDNKCINNCGERVWYQNETHKQCGGWGCYDQELLIPETKQCVTSCPDNLQAKKGECVQGIQQSTQLYIIIGAAAGGLVLLIIIIVSIVCCVKNKKRKQEQEMHQQRRQIDMMPQNRYKIEDRI